MTSSYSSAFITSLILAAIQGLAAIPWLCALDQRSLREQFRKPTLLLVPLYALLPVAVGLAALMLFRADPAKLDVDGRVFASILHLQLGLDAILIVIGVMLVVWPKGGTVAMAAFREGYRQPMFLAVAAIATLVLLVALVLPYFSFGDDFRTFKGISSDVIKIATVLFAVLAGCISICEEIEGRTAVTLMSKPVTRRQFLLGKYFGILLAAALLALILGWIQDWALFFRPGMERLEDSFDPMAVEVQSWIAPWFGNLGSTPVTASLLKGVGMWVGDAVANMGGLLLGFCQVIVLLAVAVSLATRLPLIVSIVSCMSFFLLGNLAPILAQVSAKIANKSGGAMNLVSFIAQLLDKVMPSLGLLGTDQVYLRDSYLDPMQFAQYVGSVLLYAVMYAAMALLGGLFMIEDRDLA